LYGAIEAGGTKFVCGIGSSPENLRITQIPTTTPDVTIAEAVRFFKGSTERIKSVGIGSFGPVDLRRGSRTFGYITSTPKEGWKNYDLAGNISRALKVPVGFDTDVNASALGEMCYGAGRGLTDCLYITVGTGIGGGAIVNGSILHGLIHPEMGHIRIPHDLSIDPFPGVCPFHRDCLEGLASGPSMQARWGIPPQELPEDHEGWELEAHYLALGLVSWICVLSPQRIILGGGVMQMRRLLGLIHKELSLLINRYIKAHELNEGIFNYIVSPGLGNRAGVIGALVLAEKALAQPHSHP
jgi:fructokinase